MLKTSIRGDILKKRRQLSVQECVGKSLRAQQRLLSAAEFGAASSLALYSPILNEVFTEEIFRQARQEKRLIAYPRVKGSTLEFIEVESPQDLRPGAFGVMEPEGACQILVEGLDMVVVPGVAFDRSGFRLGYGKGFYDRALHDAGPGTLRIGLCFELQLVDFLPAERHDVAMDMIITEERILRFSPPHNGISP